MVSDATPPLSGALPSNVAPSKNCILPVAVEGETVAMNVTGCPLLDGLRLDVNVVVVLALFTVCEIPVDVLLLNVLLPLYRAVIVCVPADRLDTESVAKPLASSADDPRVVAPSRNVTVPVGVPDELPTKAVNPTLCPYVDEFGCDVSDVVVAIKAPFTVCVRIEDVLAAYVLSPL
jgi:hypothetical protein